jgi:hypothetical protein
MDQRISNELRRQWVLLNRVRFHGGMKAPYVDIWPRLGQAGVWRRGQRGLWLDSEFARTRPWGLVLDELARQMAHQYVDEVRGLTGEPAHTAAYLRECAQRGLAHTSAGGHDTRCLGQHRARVTSSERAIATLLSEHLLVGTNWRWICDPRSNKKGWVLEISGPPAHLELAASAFDLLHGAADHMWKVHKRQQGLRGEAGRRAYQAGLLDGLAARLREQQERHHTECPDANIDEIIHMTERSGA